MSIKTYKVKHKTNFGNMFDKAYQIALFAQSKQGTKMPTSKDVKHFGLKSAISNQILRKYYANRKLKSIKKDKIKLIVPNQSIDFNKEIKAIKIISLKLELNCWFNLSSIIKINQIELDREYAHVVCSVEDEPIKKITKYIGIDLNSTSHSIVVGNQATGNVKKYGKQIPFLKKKYKNLRKKNQKQRAFKLIKKQSKREQNKTKDILHKITTKIVKEAKETGCGIKIENLKGISKKNTKKYHKENNYTLNSWPFFEFRRMLNYKCLLSGIKLEIVEPAFTSQTCFRCKMIYKSNRIGKLYKCPCGHLEHADVNAAFNIASRLGFNPNENEIVRTGKLASRESNSFESKETLELLHIYG